eukprot:SAG22_NODE_1486_length_4323_cov_3.859848_2_plen_596_part_00
MGAAAAPSCAATAALREEAARPFQSGRDKQAIESVVESAAGAVGRAQAAQSLLTQEAEELTATLNELAAEAEACLPAMEDASVRAQTNVRGGRLLTDEVEALRNDLQCRGLRGASLSRICRARITRQELADLVTQGKSALEAVLGEAWQPPTKLQLGAEGDVVALLPLAAAENPEHQYERPFTVPLRPDWVLLKTYTYRPASDERLGPDLAYGEALFGAFPVDEDIQRRDRDVGDRSYSVLAVRLVVVVVALAVAFSDMTSGANGRTLVAFDEDGNGHLSRAEVASFLEQVPPRLAEDMRRAARGKRRYAAGELAYLEYVETRPVCTESDDDFDGDRYLTSGAVAFVFGLAALYIAADIDDVYYRSYNRNHRDPSYRAAMPAMFVAVVYVGLWLLFRAEDCTLFLGWLRPVGRLFHGLGFLSIIAYGVGVIACLVLGGLAAGVIRFAEVWLQGIVLPSIPWLVAVDGVLRIVQHWLHVRSKHEADARTAAERELRHAAWRERGVMHCGAVDARCGHECSGSLQQCRANHYEIHSTRSATGAVARLCLSMLLHDRLGARWLRHTENLHEVLRKVVELPSTAQDRSNRDGLRHGRRY